MEKSAAGVGGFLPVLRQAMDQEVAAPALSQIVVNVGTPRGDKNSLH